MRGAVLSAALVLSFGCNEGVPDGADFGSGGSGVATNGASTGSGPDTGTATEGSGPGDGSAGAESGGTTGAPAASSGLSGDESSSDTSPTGGADSGEGESGSSSTGAGESGDETGGVAVGDDACGFPLDGPWIEIEYNQAGGTATSPSWSYSETPGWGESQWASSNASWPEVWDLYQNINVSNDPIGVVAVVGGSGQLQLMLGFEELIGYDYATVCVEGRSVSTSASVQFDAYNPLTGIGNSATMAHDWSMHATGLDLGYAFEPGGGVQAVRLDTTGGSGSLGVKRMRLVVHGAVY
ncbi:MAG: hypothetical protein ACRBN8_01070 [Nannocystales bacterium]